jgi:hypothetical protein
MSQRALNKAVKWSWPELQSRNNDALRVVLLTERDILLYSAVASAVYWQTRWQDAPANFADVEHYATQALERLLMPIDICELVADCIRDNESVQEAIQGTSGSGYGPKTVINNTQYTNNVFISGDADDNDCSPDAKFGRIKSLVAYIDEVMLDFFQVIDAATNILGQLDELISAAPVFETLPIDEAIGVIGSTGEFWKDSYDASVNTQLLEDIECELWCAYGDNCDVTVGDVRELILERYNFNSTQGALNVFSAFAVFARIAGTIAAGGVGTYIGADFVYLSWLLQLSAIEATGTFFGVDPIDYVSAASDGTPSAGWVQCGCDNCTDYDFTASDGGWYALAGVGSTYVSGSGWQRGTGSQQSRTAIIIDTDPTVTIATISVTLSVSMDGTRRDAQLYKDAALDLDQTVSVGNATTFTFAVNTNATRFMVYLRNDPSPGGKAVPGYIVSAQVCRA